MLNDLVGRIQLVGRREKRALLVVHDVLVALIALWAAFAVRLGFADWESSQAVIVAAAVSALALIAALYFVRVYHIVLRYFDMRPVPSLLGAAAMAAMAWVVSIYLLRAEIGIGGNNFLVPRSVGLIYCCFLFLLLFLDRFIMSQILQIFGRPLDDAPDSKARNIIIYGANAVGMSLAQSLRGKRAIHVRGFVDDDAALHRQLMSGMPIYRPADLPELVKDKQLHEAYLAIPSATRAQRTEAIARLRQLDLQVKTVPAPEEIVSGRYTVTDVRPVDVNDLLRRDPVEPLRDLIDNAVLGRSVLVTGAGGSIGSEICRQVARNGARRLVLLDHSEFNLFSIEQELEELMASVDPDDQPMIVSVIGSILDDRLIRDVLKAHGIDTLYHAAAYKHVPLLEANEVIGVENNVLGTLNLVQAACDAKLTRFTMISTDKAVRPKSVMGASKRVAEMIIQAVSSDTECATHFAIVRFGNVLDSSGSVVQKFRQQISQGGPITVTDPKITRFFMSIPEATQLVLQASAMGSRGDVFVLDMGESVRIAELAQQMIILSGMTLRDADNPEGDIEIAYVGLRPGEKLYEELFVGSETLPTEHPRISMAQERFLTKDLLFAQLTALRQEVAARDGAAVRNRLRELIAEDGLAGTPRLSAITAA